MSRPPLCRRQEMHQNPSHTERGIPLSSVEFEESGPCCLAYMLSLTVGMFMSQYCINNRV
jgi:hypothetical protein